jgi:hypothetical protein
LQFPIGSAIRIIIEKMKREKIRKLPVAAPLAATNLSLKDKKGELARRGSRDF